MTSPSHSTAPRLIGLGRTSLVLSLLLVAACSTRTTLGTADGGLGGDAAAADDAGRCTLRCGPDGTCCAGGEECVVDRCLPSCEGTRCGSDDRLCCNPGDLCVGGACVAPGNTCVDLLDCGPTETCDPAVRRCVPVPEPTCIYIPPTGEYQPELVWQWTDGEVLATPLVIQLTDDNSDGEIDARDTPDVVVPTYSRLGLGAPTENGRLTALSGADGSLLWQTPSNLGVCPSATPAAGDVDNDGDVEIAMIARPNAGCQAVLSIEAHVVLVDHRGVPIWTSVEELLVSQGAVAIANLDGIGDAEIVASGFAFDSDGTRLWDDMRLLSPGGDNPVIADVDRDGRQEVMTAMVALRHDGTELWSHPYSSQLSAAVAIGRLITHRPEYTGPQLVAVSGTHFSIIDALSGDFLVGPLQHTEGELGWFAGPATIADLDGDGRPEITAAGEDRYIAFDLDLPPPYIKWSLPSEDLTSGSTGSTVFDFEGDGAAEVLFNDECHMRIHDGRTGALRASVTNTSGTAFEYPVVVDLNNDGTSEIVVGSNIPGTGETCDDRTLPFTGNTHGLRVFRDARRNWVPTRSVWNQHAYAMGNVREDGTIPAQPDPSWLSHNTFRLNQLVDPEAVHLAADLTIEALNVDATACPLSVMLRARVKNRGARSSPRGVRVTFLSRDAAEAEVSLGQRTIDRPLLAGEAVWVELRLESPTVSAEGTFPYFARVDDPAGPPPTERGDVNECHEDNNDAARVLVDCRGPI